jgi:hypothetical protein
MQQIKSGVRSTKETNLKPGEDQHTALDILKQISALKKKHKDMFIQTVEEFDVFYTNQTGKFPYNSSGGY